MRKLIALLLAITMLATLSIPAFAEDKPILIGLSAKLTGSEAANGKRMANAAQMAVDEVNAAGGLLGRKVELNIQDDAGDSTQALNVANLLISSGVNVTVGPWNSGSVLSVEGVYRDAGIPFFGLGTNPKLLALNNPYAFLGRANDKIMAASAAKMIIDELGVKSVGILYGNNEFGTGAMEIISSKCTDAGLKVVAEAIGVGDTDATGQVLSLKNAGVECMVVWANDAEYVLAAQQSYDLGLSKGIPVVASPAVTMDQVRELCEPEWIEGWYAVTDFINTNPDEKNQAFCKKYLELYGQPAELYVSGVYGVFQMIFNAINTAGSSEPQAIRDALAATKDFLVPNGIATCDQFNEMIHSVAIAQIVNYAPAQVKAISVELD
jgi:branched-chain amino acid transport system substrate-binding protein